MDKNKSIDGLSTRRSKRTAPSSNQPPMKTAPRAKKASAPKPIKPAIRPATKKTPPKATPKPVKPPVSKTSPKTRADITADFLKPVQAFNFDGETGKLSVSEEPMSKPEEEPKKIKPKKIKKPWSKKRRIITWSITVIFIIIGALASWLILWGNDIIAKITSGQGNIFDLIFTGESYVELKADENGRTNILAFGTSGYTMDGEYGNGIHDGAQLTDSIMVLSFNQSTNDLVMLSLPRDLKASPTCTATSKINEIYWCNNIEGNNELAGAEALMTEVGAILGIDFQYFAHLNWGALVHIVNTLGGITVTLDEDISDYYFTGAVFKAGEPYTINGEQALGLARARHGTASGDFSRGASQQKILIGIKDRITEKGLSISDMISLAGTLGDNLRTNFSIDEMKSIANLTKNFDMNRIRQISLLEPERLMTTGNINGISYVLPSAGVGNYGKIQNYIAKMTSNDPRVYENPSILVLNGTGEVGIATNEKTRLENNDYTDVDIDNAPEGEYLEHYNIYALNDSKPGTKYLLEQFYGTTAKPATELPEGITRDYDFVIIVGNENKTTEN